MDGKYGRLFTLDDMARVLAYGEGRDVEPVRASIEQVLGIIDGDGTGSEGVPIPTLTFPADEPLFLLRAQDAAAPITIAAVTDANGVLMMGDDYVRNATVIGSPPEHGQAATMAAQAMADWQAAHPDRVKVPD